MRYDDACKPLAKVVERKVVVPPSPSVAPRPDLQKAVAGIKRTMSGILTMAMTVVAGQAPTHDPVAACWRDWWDKYGSKR